MSAHRGWWSIITNQNLQQNIFCIVFNSNWRCSRSGLPNSNFRNQKFFEKGTNSVSGDFSKLREKWGYIALESDNYFVAFNWDDPSFRLYAHFSLLQTKLTMKNFSYKLSKVVLVGDYVFYCASHCSELDILGKPFIQWIFLQYPKKQYYPRVL